MNLQKLMEKLMGIKRPMGLLDLQNRGFKNTNETNLDSRIQIFGRDKYRVIYDTFEKEVVNVYREYK